MVLPSSSLCIFMDLNRAIPCWNFEHVSFTLACASPEIGLLNLCRMLQNAAGSGEVVEHGLTEAKMYLQQRGRGRHLLLLLSLLRA